MAGKPIGSFYVGLGLDTREFQRKMRLAERDLQAAFGSAAIRTSQALAASIAGVTAAVGYLGAKSVKLAADLETQTKAFQRLLGGADAAKAKLEELQAFAAETPFTFTEVTDATKRLLALGFAADEVIPVLTSVGDAASGLGLDSGGMDRIIKAFGDIRSKGVLATQEIKQLAESGIPAFEILAQNLGVTIPEAMKLVEDRAVDSQTAVNAFMSGINQRFGGMMAIQSKTMIGMWSTVVDETENIMRKLGGQISAALDLKDSLRKLKDQLATFRVDVENMGIADAFSKMIGDKVRVAIYAVAGAIAGALVPAVISLGLAFKSITIPLAALTALGALAGALAGIWSSLTIRFKASRDLIQDAVKTTAIIIKNQIFKVINEVEYAIKNAIARTIQLFAQSSVASRALGIDLQKLADEWKSAAINDAGQATLLDVQNEKLRERLGLLWDAYNQSTSWIDLMNGQGMNNIVSIYDRMNTSLSQMVANLTKVIPLSGFLKNITGQGKNASAPASAPTGGKSSGQSEAEKLAEEAKRTSESILQSYTQRALGKSAMLDLEYQRERENLDRSKAYNKNYRRDLFMLDEVFYQRRIELARESQEAEAKLQAELGVSRAEYVREQMEAEAALTEAKFERMMAEADGSALEAQLNADRQAADLESYIQHLNEKSAADRAYLEGRRNLIEVYDQLQRDANRSNADFMAESYRMVYYGLTDALTGIVTGAKNAGEAFKELGMQIIQMVVKWQIQKRLAAVMSKSLEASQTAASVAMAATTAAAWAPAAAMVAAATFGASTAAGAAGLTSLNALSRALAIPGLATGGIVTKPTLAMIGEGGESEAVIPLSRLGEMGGGANVQVNVINQTGVPVNARTSQRTDGGKVVVDLFLEGYSRNVSGIQDIIGRRS